MNIHSLRIEAGRLFVTDDDGKDWEFAQPELPEITLAIEHKGKIIATDGWRVIAIDGETSRDITEGFRKL